jgi:hypothetical protein
MNLSFLCLVAAKIFTFSAKKTFVQNLMEILMLALPHLKDPIHGRDERANDKRL